MPQVPYNHHHWTDPDMMQMAMAVGECSGEDADLLRRAMGSKRGLERIDSLREKLYAGMASNGLVGQDADDIYARSLRAARKVQSAVVRATAWPELRHPRTPPG